MRVLRGSCKRLFFNSLTHKKEKLTKTSLKLNDVCDNVLSEVTMKNFLVALLGGGWGDGSGCGAWCLHVLFASSYRARAVGGRLLYVHFMKICVYPHLEIPK